MGPDQQLSRSSRTSLISLDPVIARQIASYSNTGSRIAHIRTESTPTRTTIKPLAANTRSHGRTISAPNRQPKKRSTSLRRAKNSTELLKQRAVNTDKNARGSETTDGLKRGRNFAVTNVGTGGMLYLRPSPHPISASPTVSTPAPNRSVASPVLNLFPPVSAANATHDKIPAVRTRSISPRRLLQHATHAKNTRSERAKHVRSQSFSTVDETRKSISANPKTLRIVINRPRPSNSMISEAESMKSPTLDVPIPHYKLGNPRFSAHGTPHLNGSSGARTSFTPSTNHSSMILEETTMKHPTVGLQVFSDTHNLPYSGDDHPEVVTTSVQLPNGEQFRSSSSTTSLDSPISPRLYDDLAEVYHDPTVVRYSHSVKDISAATRARIIAQISSESFMDYELVSDFFLTFRSYMSTFEVLELLLARLKWSINRLTEDGRIIRIRTFAALRHWILNYFMDDFVVNRRLRVRFCDEVNKLYDEIKERPVAAIGSSDLKILQDLKRCWNGRCSLYWDATQFNVDGNQVAMLIPGGVVGSRNPTFIDTSEINATADGTLTNTSQVLPSPLPINSPNVVRTNVHQRSLSGVLARKTASLESDPSIQAQSCFILRQPHRDSQEGSLQIKGPHLVSVLSRRHNAPSDLKVNTHSRSDSKNLHHKRAGSSMDNSRSTTPMEPNHRTPRWSDPHTGSIIRGLVYGPVEPFIQIPIDPPLSPVVRFDETTTTVASTRNGPQLRGAPQAPAMKNIIGSLRRALSGKQPGQEITVIAIASPTGGKKSAIPVHMSRSHEDLRKKAAGIPNKQQIRIDLLCAASIQKFQMLSHSAARNDNIDAYNTAFGDFPFTPPLSQPEENKEFSRPGRVGSNDTAESGSILIVDDTGSEMPAMSGALPFSYSHDGNRSDFEAADHERSTNQDHTSLETQIVFRQSVQDKDAGVGGGNEEGEEECFLKDDQFQRPNDQRSDTGSSITIKDQTSVGSSVPRQSSMEASATTLSPDLETDDGEDGDAKGPSQVLRRRPGGDLRKNQNVHELETTVHHDSFDSIMNPRSEPGSVLMLRKSSDAIPVNPFKKVLATQVSMINTHSSQQLRPSFEAAVAGLSAIPDDDDGGLEATLSKLEGRFSPKLPDREDLGHGSPGMPIEHQTSPLRPVGVGVDTAGGHGRIVDSGPLHQQEDNGFGAFYFGDNMGDNISSHSQGEDLNARDSPLLGHTGFVTLSNPASSSEGSLPLLKRDTVDVSEQMSSRANNPSQLGAPFQRGSRLTYQGVQTSSSIDHNSQLSNSNQPNYSHMSHARPDTADTEGGQSFLLDEDENLSDLSSDISVDIINYTNPLVDPMSPMLTAPGTAVSGLEIPSHPLTHASLIDLAIHPSPSLAVNRGNQLPTPDASPVLTQGASGERQVNGQHDIIRSGLGSGSSLAQWISGGPAHIPFILACDSQLLAQQLTIVEQSALTEIEWTDLVEMRWDNKSANILDWAEYMMSHSSVRGIDLVINRFNLMIKWVLSEIMLTQNVHERVRVISKYIHIAAHARRLHNYASMLQITIALTSSDCTRLIKTWELVSSPDKSLLRNMEALIQPVRNFHDLRQEMETADLDDGCIPFIGLYVHDLTYNAQKPKQIEIDDDHEPLVNFERFRTAAVIIKGLLRLIDASSKYDFEPVHGIVERCLWMSALTDNKIHSLSKSLE